MFRDEIFSRQRVDLDGKEFYNCQFDHCTLIYRGGALPTMQDCTANHCRFELADAAERTIEYLRSIYHGWGDFGGTLIEDLFRQIRHPH
jgi:hypothetical protein